MPLECMRNTIGSSSFFTAPAFPSCMWSSIVSRAFMFCASRFSGRLGLYILRRLFGRFLFLLVVTCWRFRVTRWWYQRNFRVQRLLLLFADAVKALPELRTHSLGSSHDGHARTQK